MKIRLCNSKTIRVTSAVAQKVLPQEEAPTCEMLKIVELQNSFVFQDNIVDTCEIAMECIEHYADDFLFIQWDFYKLLSLCLLVDIIYICLTYWPEWDVEIKMQPHFFLMIRNGLHILTIKLLPL